MKEKNNVQQQSDKQILSDNSGEEQKVIQDSTAALSQIKFNL